jgi:hypothetical protein
MPLSEDQKKAMREGRQKAALARREAKALNPSDLPAGADRREAVAIVKDALQEKIEKRQERDGIAPLDAAKMAQRDNEILSHLDHAGNIPLKNQEPGKRYVFLTVADGYEEDAKANIAMMHANAETHGFHPVQGDSPVARDLIGAGRCSGTTLRGVGDTVLYEQREEDARKMEAGIQRKLDIQGAVEENSVIYARDRLAGERLPNTMRGTSGDYSYSELVQRMAGPAGHGRTNFTEGDLRRGSLRGPDGQVMQPGYEQGRLR